MKNQLKVITLGFLLFAGLTGAIGQEKVGHFDKVTVNPNIEVVFKQGNEESVLIKHANISEDRIRVQVSNNRLKLSIKGWNTNPEHNPYEGTKASIVVTYRTMEELTLKGDQKVEFQSELNAEEFEFNIYGDSDVYVSKADIDHLEANLFGDNTLHIATGFIDSQDYTVFGDCDVNTTGVANNITKIISFGDADFEVNVSDFLKVNGVGDASVSYTGNPEVSNWISLGDTSITQAR